MKKSTVEFENRIERANSIEELRGILAELPKADFMARFSELADKYNMSFSKIQFESGITKSLFYAFFNPDPKAKRKPQKHHVIKMGLAMGASVEELNELLKLAQHKELYAKRKEDAIIIFGINKKMKPIEIEELLVESGASFSLMEK